jgi:hypothetical protein
LEPLFGSELDVALAIALYGEKKSRPVAYSTSETAASRLLSSLRRNFQLEASIESVGDLWHCRLTGRNGTIATGTGETRPLSIARAAMNANPKLLHPPVEPGRLADPLPLGAGDPPARAHCPTCGRPVRGLKAVSAPLCNVCRWHRTNERAFGFAPARAGGGSI